MVCGGDPTNPLCKGGVEYNNTGKRYSFNGNEGVIIQKLYVCSMCNSKFRTSALGFVEVVEDNGN